MKKHFTKFDFYKLLKENNGCLEWTKSLTKAGYGVTYVNNKLMYTHRLALLLEGIDPGDLMVLHSCDNPKCCNPAHLSVGTHSDNMNDMISKNRCPVGQDRYNAKHTEEDVLKMREMYSNGIKTKEIAKIFNISSSCAMDIIKKRRWKHI